jgi:hypothetical protein
VSDIIHEAPFIGHIDESIRDEIADSSTVYSDAANIRQDDMGGAQKRLGTSELPRTLLGGSSIAAGQRLFGHNTDIAVTNPLNTLHVYSPALNQFINKAEGPFCTYKQRPVPTPTAAALLVDTEYCNNYVVVTHQYGGASSLPTATLVEAATGTIVMSPTNIPGAAANAIALVGSYSDRYFLLFANGSVGQTIVGYYLDTQNIAAGWVSFTTGVTGLVSGNAFAVCSLTNRVALAYGTDSGTNRVTVKTFTIAGVVETTTVSTSSTNISEIDVHGSIADTLWVGWSITTTVRMIGLDADSLASVLATTAVVLTMPTGNAIRVRVVESGTAGSAGEARVLACDETALCTSMNQVSTSAGATTPLTQTNVYNLLVCSKPFVQGVRFYVWTYSGATSPLNAGNNAQALCVLTDFTFFTARPVLNFEPGLVPAQGLTSKSPAISSTKRMFGVQVLRSAASDLVLILSGTGTLGSVLVEMDFADRKRGLPVLHAGNTILGGGVTLAFDGDRCTELAMIAKPTKPTAVGGSTGIDVVNVRYACVYEDIDSAGNVTISGVSAPSDLVNETNKTITVTTKPLVLSLRNTRNSSRVAFYRTADNGNVFYRLGVTQNNATASTITFADATTEANLTAGSLLYFTGVLPGTNNGPQDRRAPPGLLQLVSYNGMLVGIKGSSIVFSGQEVYGEAPWFSPAFEVPVTADGDFTAIAHQDGTIYGWKRKAIYAVAGEAPSDNGATGGLGTPRKLATDVGCIDASSVVVTAIGIFFQSERGIELLDRSGNVVDIGSKVQASVAAFPVCASAVLDHRNGLVRFAMTTGESAGVVTGTSITLVYDLVLREWMSKDFYPSNEAVQSGAVVFYSNAYRYAWLGTDGEVHYERDVTDGSAYLDGSTWITQRVITVWMHPAGINGENVLSEHILLAKQYTGHDLTISIGFDYASSYASTRTFTAAQIAALASEWISREISQTTCTAVRFKFEDATPSSGSVGTGRGAAWVARTLKGVAKPGMKRTSGAQRGA